MVWQCRGSVTFNLTVVQVTEIRHIQIIKRGRGGDSLYNWDGMLLSYILNYRIFNSWVIPPPKEGSLRYNLYKKKEGGGGSSPLFGVNWRAVSRLSWPLFCSGIKIPLSWGISMKQKQRDRFVKTLVFCQHISSWPRDFEKGIWLVVCKEKIEFYCGIGLSKTRRSGLESGLDVAFWGGTQ